MSNPLLSVDAARWPKTRRRWMTVLGVLLTINMSLVVVAVRGYTTRSDAPVGVANGDGASDPIVSDPPSVAAPQVAIAPATTPLEPSAPLPEPAAQPAVSASPATASSAVPDAASFDATDIVIVNPLDNGGVVHFLFADEVYSLQPGEYWVLDGCIPTQLTFHQGDELDDC